LLLKKDILPTTPPQIQKRPTKKTYKKDLYANTTQQKRNKRDLAFREGHTANATTTETNEFFSLQRSDFCDFELYL